MADKINEKLERQVNNFIKKKLKTTIKQSNDLGFERRRYGGADYAVWGPQSEEITEIYKPLSRSSKSLVVVRIRHEEVGRDLHIHDIIYERVKHRAYQECKEHHDYHYCFKSKIAKQVWCQLEKAFHRDCLI